MKIVEKPSKITDQPVLWLKFTYDEEIELARTVMTILSTRWVDEEYRSIARAIYDRKCQGQDIEAYLLNDLYEKIMFWNDRFKNNDDIEEIPIPLIDDEKEDYIRPPSANRKNKALTLERKIQWCKNEVQRAWKEVWTIHREEMMIISDDFVCFPNDEAGWKEYQDELARDFWKAVEASQKRFKLSRTQAIREVSDHTPRGSLDVTDPNPGNFTSSRSFAVTDEELLSSEVDGDDFIID